MKKVYKYSLITALLALGLGVLAIIPVVQSDNGYVAGFVYLPILILIAIVTLILFIVGVILAILQKKVGPYILLAALLLPTGFCGSALVSKQLELGAYREDPMVPLIREVANIVLFKNDTTHDQIEKFWEETLSTQREDGRGYEHLPGLRGIGRLPSFEGHEVVEFDFFDNATDEEREYVYSRVRSSPIVFKLLENVSTKEYMGVKAIPANDNSTGRPKKGLRIDNLKQR